MTTLESMLRLAKDEGIPVFPPGTAIRDVPYAFVRAVIAVTNRNDREQSGKVTITADGT